MKKYVILHGHFYQPPREDPWTGLIEHQISAAPFPDWNKRIAAECYAACASSRVLDKEGRIVSMVNNYQTLSFNFGPTLLSWMESEAPNVYKKILSADGESRERLGWGNAVAQSFNHTILPLDNEEDARTQVNWGLADFERRFEREADGMWLPECAVNEKVIDILIEKGLKYVILSPWQAASLKDKSGKKTVLKNQPAPSDRAFRISRPGGSIAAFFYDPDLASGISFGHLLRSREGFEIALREKLSKNDGALVSIATDGEIYGHHEPYGDMCLAALTDTLKQDSDIIFTNFAAYLAANPPTEEAEIRLGDDGLGSSWSCAHGVGRWMRDCGCSTGGEEGWNQLWRGSLRKAFDGLRKAAGPLWEAHVESLTGEKPRDVLDDYGSVVCGSESPGDFARRKLKDRCSENNSRLLLSSLEGARYIQYSYTSCGWFFSELSGIEPVQNIRYAYRATELLDPDGSAGLALTLEELLEPAKSNIMGHRSGADILREDVIPGIPPAAKTAALFFWLHLYKMREMVEGRWGAWRMLNITRNTVDTDEADYVQEGQISYEEISTGIAVNLPYRAVINGRLFCPEIEVHLNGDWVMVPISAMPTVMRAETQKTLLRRSERKLKQFLGNHALIRLRDLRMVQELHLPFGASGWQSLELSLHYGPILTIDRLAKLSPEHWPEALRLLDEILQQREAHGVDSDLGALEARAGNLVSELAEQMLSGCDAESLEQVVSFLEILHRHGLRPLKPIAQNAVYALLKNRFVVRGCDDASSEELSNSDLLSLADLMNINPERFISG